MKGDRQLYLPTVLLVLLGLLSGSCFLTAANGEDDHLRRLFESLDRDHDGQLMRQELKQYIGSLAPEYSSSTKLDQAVEAAIGRLDSPDVGFGVSWKELEHHLHTLLQDVKVADWVTHGLGLPQYAEAFRSNSITALDLPMLVNDGGKLLQTELKVESPLHRQQLLRAMQRQILGLGSPPGPVQHLLCVASQPAVTTPTAAAADASSTQELAAADAATAAGTAAGAGAGAAGAAGTARAGAAGVVCSWLPPADAGQPGMHKYLLQRVDHSSAAATWQTVAELQDSLSVRYRDVPPQPGVYQYRLAAWNVYGRSPYVLSHDVTVPSATGAAAAAATTDALPTAAGMQGMRTGLASSGQQAPHVVAYAAGPQQPQQNAASSSGMVPNLPLVWPQQPPPQQHGRGMGSCGPTDESSEPACVNIVQEQLSTGQAIADPQACSPEGQGSSSVVWLVGLDAQQRWQHSTPATAAGRAAQQGLAASMRAAGAADAHRSAALVSGAAPTGTAAGGSSGSNGKPAMTARLAALLGSAWHSSMDGWLKALVNSLTAFVLVVLPICVRLLPVQTLAQIVQALAWLLHFLPEPVRQRLLVRPAATAAVPDVLLEQHQLGSVLLLASEVPGASQGSLLGDRGSGTGSGSGGSRTGTPQKLVLLEGSTAGASFAPGLVGQSGGAQGGQGSAVSSVTAPVVGAAASADVAAAAGARRRLMPRSISDFDLVRQHRAQSPAKRPGACRSFSNSPVSSRSFLAGLPATGAPAGPRCVSEGATAAAAPGVASANVARDLQLASHSSDMPGTAVTAEAGRDSVGAERIAGGAAVSRVAPAGAAAGDAGDADSGGDGMEREQDLRQYLLYSSHGSVLPNNKCCGFPGCQQQFGLRHWKATLQRHYCGRCQQAFCMQHTAYSPHGTSGTCGVQSRCLCIDCFYEYTPEYQAFLASRNTLVGKRSRSGPPAAAAAAAAFGGPWEGEASMRGRDGGSTSAGGRAGSVLSRLVPLGRSSSSKQVTGAGAAGAGSASCLARRDESYQAKQGHQLQAGVAPVSAAAPAHVSGAPLTADGSDSAEQLMEHSHEAMMTQQQPQPQLTRRSSLGVGAMAVQPAAACSQGMKSRMLWGRGLTKALGVVRFKHAGDVHGASQSALPGAAAAGVGAPAPAVDAALGVEPVVAAGRVTV